VTAPLLLALALSVGAAPPGWCEGARARLLALDGIDVEHDAGHVTDVESLLATLPPMLAARAREDQGRGGRRGAAVDAATTAIRFACDVDTVADARADAARVLRDARFRGARSDEDVVDRVLDRLWRWIEATLASEGMQVFADHTRTIYLATLVVVAAFVAIRLARNARRAQALSGRTPALHVERERARAFAAWRSEAQRMLEEDPRRAVLLARAALLARVGEVDVDAVRPARTSREVLSRLAPDLAAAAGPPLHSFDALFFGGPVDVDAARALLAAVDAAVAAWESSRSSRPAAGGTAATATTEAA
jgi:hypothetical protein